jgi:signal transduction histidine kinase
MTKINFIRLQMLRLPGFSVNTRIILPFLLAIIVIAGIGVFTVTRLVAGSVQERLHNQLLDSANAAGNSIVDIERQLLAVLRLMVFTEGVPSAIHTGDVVSLDTWLRPIAANARIDEFIIFDRSSRVLLHLRRATEAQYEVKPPVDISAWVGAQSVLTGETDSLGDKFVDVATDEDNHYVFYISAPVKDDADQLVGGIAVGIRGSTLATRISEQSLSAVALVNADRIVGTTFRGEEAALAQLNQDYQRVLNQGDFQTPIRNVELTDASYSVLYAPFRLRDQNVGLIAVGLPSNFIADQSSTSRNVVGLLFLGLFAAITIIGLIVARTITSPITRLVNVTRSIRGGDLSIRVGLKSRDELGELGVSFDEMTDQLVSQNRKIQALYRNQLQETARRDAVLASIKDAVIVQDLQGERVLFNRTADALIEAVAQDDSQQEQFTLLMRDPTLLTEAQIVTFINRYFSVLATPVTIRNAKRIGYVVVFHDITTLIESERLKDELMLQLSHELRTPLSAVRGYVELIKLIDGANLSVQSSGFVDHAVAGIETLERMINQSIAVSQIISNRFNIEIDPFDFSALLKDLYQHWLRIAEGRSLKLTASLPDHDVWIQGDERQIREVFEQILVNACNYTLPGGEIRFEAQVEQGFVRIAIIDTGVGIDEDERDLVFERLYRGRSADAGPTDSRGLGLGLYIARYIVQAHHGSIILESKPQTGTSVFIELPLRQPVGQTERVMAAH